MTVTANSSSMFASSSSLTGGRASLACLVRFAIAEKKLTVGVEVAATASLAGPAAPKPWRSRPSHSVARASCT